MKNLLITGGCGFIGANFIRFLFKQTDFKGRIINVDKLTYAGNPDSLNGIENNYADRYVFKKTDICDQEAMASIFSEYEIDSVCHFAAESHVDRSITGPAAFIKTNIEGTFNLLENARSNIDRITCFHHVSTDEVFGSLGEEGYFTEKTQYKPNSPYSASKASSDHLVRAYFETYDLPVTITNCSNNYGPYQFPEKLIPLIFMNAKEYKDLPIYGDGKYIRDWLYVEDHCKAIWTVMNKGTKGETYAVGGDCEKMNIDLVTIMCDILDEVIPEQDRKPRKELMTFVKDRPGHDRRYAIDFSKITEELGWTPDESFETGIRKTIKWYLDNAEWVERIRSGEYKNWIEEQYVKR